MQNEDWVTGKIQLTIAGMPLEMELTVPVKPVKPQRMLPIFQQMTSSFVNFSVRAEEETGKTISCQAGCGACCRQVVPISEIEVYQLAALVESLEEPRRSEIKQRFADGCEHFHEKNWFGRMEECAAQATGGDQEKARKEMQNIALEYFYERIPCPFLENESCSIHEVRPLVCREYLVTSPAENCSHPSAETIDKVEIITKLSNPLKALAHTEIAQNFRFVPLIRALELADKFPENLPEKSGERWTAEFFEQLTKTEIPGKGIAPKSKPKSKNRMKRRRF